MGDSRASLGVELPSQASAIPVELDQLWHELSGSVSIKDIDEAERALGQERARSQRSAEKLRQLDQIFEEEHFPPPPPVPATHSGPLALPWAAGLPKAPPTTDSPLPLSTVPLYEAAAEVEELGEVEVVEAAAPLPEEPAPQREQTRPPQRGLTSLLQGIDLRPRLPRWVLFSGGGVLGVGLVLALVLPGLLAERTDARREQRPVIQQVPVKPAAPPPVVKATPPPPAPVVKATPPPPPPAPVVKATPPPPPPAPVVKATPPPVKPAPAAVVKATPPVVKALVKKQVTPPRLKRHEVARVKRRLERCSRSLRAQDAVAQLGNTARLQLQLGRCAARHRDAQGAIEHYQEALRSDQLSSRAARRVRRIIARLEKK